MGVDYPYNKLAAIASKKKTLEFLPVLLFSSFFLLVLTREKRWLVSKVAISNPYSVSYPHGWAY
jgi:hypothetical protein